MKIPGSETKSRRPNSEKLKVMISLGLDQLVQANIVLQGSMQSQLVAAPLEFIHKRICHRVAFVGSDRNFHKGAILSGPDRDLHHHRQMV